MYVAHAASPALDEGAVVVTFGGQDAGAVAHKQAEEIRQIEALGPFEASELLVQIIASQHDVAAVERDRAFDALQYLPVRTARVSQVTRQVHLTIGNGAKTEVGEDACDLHARHRHLARVALL